MNQNIHLGLLVSVTLLSLICSDMALATESDLITFKSVYPHVVGLRLDSCLVCHSEPVEQPSTLNSYGMDYSTAGRDDSALVQIAVLDSDGDLFSNLIEIEQMTFPGDGLDFPILTATPTDTPLNETPTDTPTITPSNTPTYTLTDTPTITPSNTPTYTLTDTPTTTSTQAPSYTQTHTPTSTPTLTPTFTPTPTPTHTQTNTPTHSPTATDSATPSPTETPSGKPTATPTAKRSFDLNGDGFIDQDDLLLLLQDPDAADLLFEFLLYWGTQEMPTSQLPAP